MNFLLIAVIVGLAFLIWDCIEVGRNDAANLVNAVFGARVMERRKAVYLAGAAVILGATFAAPVMETARKGIFDPTLLTVQMALAIYISVYFVDTLLLYTFSAFGMPVSTTACLVFELVGAAMFLAGFDNVNWPKVGSVTTAIFVSIAVSGVASFMVMRVFRGAIQTKYRDRDTLLLHGPWICGAILTCLGWFMIFKGMKNVAFVKSIRSGFFEEYGVGLVLLLMWAGFTFIVHMILVFNHRRGIDKLFSVMAILGMICMAFAFGQNDLANAASPGLAALNLWQSGSELGDLADLASKIPIPIWALTGCGILMASGMFSSYAQRVTRAEVNTGSQFEHVALYAPNWCRRLAGVLLRFGPKHESLAPTADVTDSGKKIHYDALRASVITAVSASVIAFASGRGMPVSTTYVAFAAVLGTGAADCVYTGGPADLKLGRAVWVIACWCIAPIIAILATGLVANIVYHLAVPGIFLAVLLNFGLRRFFKKRADAHEACYHGGTDQEATEEGAE